MENIHSETGICYNWADCGKTLRLTCQRNVAFTDQHIITTHTTLTSYVRACVCTHTCLPSRSLSLPASHRLLDRGKKNLVRITHNHFPWPRLLHAFLMLCNQDEWCLEAFITRTRVIIHIRHRTHFGFPCEREQCYCSSSAVAVLLLICCSLCAGVHVINKSVTQ